jgi:hypothetical protein
MALAARATLQGGWCDALEEDSRLGNQIVIVEVETGGGDLHSSA